MSPQTVPVLQRRIGYGLILIALLMPFHALLVTAIADQLGNRALWQGWKELVTSILAAATALALVRTPGLRRRFDRPMVICLGLFAAVALLVTLVSRADPDAALLGAKTDGEFLVLFVIALTVGTARLVGRLGRIALVTGVACALIGVALVTVLPRDLLTVFGYGPETILPYAGVAAGIDTIRTPSTLGGPNQFGAFLILPLCLAVRRILQRQGWAYLVAAAVLLSGIWVSYSRAALLGALVAVTIIVLASVRRRTALILAACGLVTGVFATAVLVSAVRQGSDLQYYILHQSATGADPAASTSQHAAAALAGLDELRTDPVGDGLGSAGPASTLSDKPVIPESGFLQLGQETGLAGLVLFIAFCGIVTARLLRRCDSLGIPLIGALAGLSLVNLVLHGWADSSTAFVFWILAGAVIGAGREVRV